MPKNGVLQLCTLELCLFKICIQHLSLVKDGPFEVCVHQLRTRQLRLSKISPLKSRHEEVGAREINTGELRAWHVQAPQIGRYLGVGGAPLIPPTWVSIGGVLQTIEMLVVALKASHVCALRSERK